MKVLIENEAGSLIKHRYDECTFKLMATRRVQRAYPFPYGFVVGTRSGDGMCLDCFLLTSKAIASGEMIEAEPIGMFEQVEDGKEDHNILAVQAGEEFELDLAVEDVLRDFVMNVFADVPGKSMTVGRFLGRDDALALIERSLT
jgi:inorganic pyrophosphatase